MYPKNSSNPPPIAIGAIYSTVDGSFVTAGASVRVKTGTGSWAAGANSPVCDTTSGTWVYTPSQAETNAESFIVAIYAASATQAVVTVVTTASEAAGYAGLDWSLVRQANTSVGLSATTISTSQQVASVSGNVGGSVASVTGAVGSVTGNVGGNVTGSVASVVGNVGGNVTGSVGSISGVTFPTNFGVLGINSSGHVSRVLLVDTTTTNADMRGTDGAALASNWTATRAGYLDSVLVAANSNRTVLVTGSNHVAAVVHDAEPDSIPEDAFITGALSARVVAADAGAEIATAVRTELATELGRIDATVGSRSTLTATQAADAVLSRGAANVESTAEAYSITDMLLGVFESKVETGTWTIYRTDGTTTHRTKTITTDAGAEPITRVQ